MLYTKLACHHCSQVEVVQGPQPDVEIQTLLLIPQRYEHLSLAPANIQGKMAPNAGFISKCVSSLVYWPGGKGPVLFCNRIPVYRFSSHLCWALIHAVGFCCQKGTNITNCPFGSQNTCNTCFFHLLRHLSSVNTTQS